MDEVVVAWEKAEADILRAWNEEPADEPTIPPTQQWALDLLSRVRLPAGAERTAAASLRVARRQAVVRSLAAIRREREADELSDREAAQEVVEVIRQHGLRPAKESELEQPAREPVGPDDIEVVCYAAIVPDR